MIKECTKEITKPLELLYKACIQTGYVPKIWQNSNSAILAKPGKTDYTNPRSYRIITLTSNLLKILETLILWHMKDDLKIEHSMAQNQYGFKKGSSTDAAILAMINRIQSALKYKQHAICGLIDIQGAFDNVPHTTIKKAIDKTKAKGMISNWIQFMVKNRFINLTNAGETINRRSPKGCPQGGVLSPFIWNIVLDPLLKELKNTIKDKHLLMT